MQTVEVLIYTRCKALVPFDSLGVVYRLVSPPDVVLVQEHYGDENIFELDVRQSQVEAFRKTLTELRLTLR